MQKHRQRVVITGLGAVTPVGGTLESTWNGLVEGKNVAAPVRRFDASGFPCKIGYEVEGYSFDTGLVSAREREVLNASGQFGVSAAQEAIAMSGFVGGVDPDRVGLSFGVGMGCPDFDWFSEVMLPKDFAHQRMHDYLKYFPGMVTSVIGRLAGAKGTLSTVHTACASSGQAVGEAFRQIASGRSDVVVAGGCDSMINPYYFAGFCLLGALSSSERPPSEVCRPFDAERDGFILGEGSGVLVLESYDHAVARGAEIIAEVAGYGVTESAYRITDLHPEGRGPIEAMQRAVQDAGIHPHNVGYINAHGTSTKLNDQVEALSIEKVFHVGEHKPYVSSTKSMTGHMISAAGAIEAIVCAQALKYQVVPPSLNFNQLADDSAPIKVSPARATSCELEAALSNSVGFGGSNTALVLKRMKS